MIAREKSPLLSGDNVCKLTHAAPALSPNIVTLSGSPPNAEKHVYNIFSVRLGFSCRVSPNCATFYMTRKYGEEKTVAS